MERPHVEGYHEPANAICGLGRFIVNGSSTGRSRSGSASQVNPERMLRGVAIGAFFLTVIALCMYHVRNIDFGWHLKTGEFIWTMKSIPTHDIFSYLVEGHRWVDSHWLFQLILYGFHDVGGTVGVTVLRALLMVGTFAMVLSTMYRKEYLTVAILVCVLALFTSHQRSMLRPELVSLFFLAGLAYCMERVSERPKSYLVASFLGQMLWTNMHGLHALGIVFAGLYFAGDAIQYRAARSFPRLSKVAMSDLKWKGGVFVAVLLASILNANGIDGILYPYKIFSELRGEVASFPLLGELRPTFSTAWPSIPWLHPISVYKVFLCVSALSWVGQLRMIRFSHALIYIAFLYLSIIAVRNIALFAIVATPITIRNLSVMLDSTSFGTDGRFPSQRAVALASALVAIPIAAATWTATANDRLYPMMRMDRVFGVGESPRFPSAVVSQLENLDGNVFNAPYWGGYLIWKLYPSKQVSFDGRWEIYGDSLPVLQRAFRDRGVFGELVEKHDIRAIVLDRQSSYAKRMLEWLPSDEAWTLTRGAPNALLYLRSDR